LRIAITDSFSNIILFRVAEMEFQKEDKLSAADDEANVLENGNVSNIPNGQPILNGATNVEAKGSVSTDSSVGHTFGMLICFLQRRITQYTLSY
jgi:hypothetical protein